MNETEETKTETEKVKIDKQVSKQITHFINTYCRDMGISFHDAFKSFSFLYENDRAEFDRLIKNHECPRKVS